MKKLSLVFLVLLFVPSIVFSGDFIPLNKLDIDVQDFVQYNFDGNPVDIPVEVSGVAGRCYLIVDTKGLAETMPYIRNGRIGWHTISGIDTTVYTSAGDDLFPGNKIITWSGMDQDGTPVPEAEYTYYVWAFDYLNLPQPACAMADYRRNCADERMLPQLRDQNYVPLAKPWLCTIWQWGPDGPAAVDPASYGGGLGVDADRHVYQKWILGNDPSNTELIETCKLDISNDLSPLGNSRPCFQPDDFNYIYWIEDDTAAPVRKVKKFKLAPNDVAEEITDWGTDLVFTYPYVGSAAGRCGVSTDNTYLYIKYGATDKLIANSRLITMSFDGELVDDVFIEEWDKAEFLATHDCADVRAGGPFSLEIVDNEGWNYTMGSDFGLQMALNPLRYLESGDTEDLVKAINEEGDGFCDKGAAPDSFCPDFTYHTDPPWNYSTYCDRYGFTLVATQRAGPISWLLMTPDYTAVDYCTIAAESDVGQDSVFPINMDTAYDGLYLHPCVWYIEKPEELAGTSLVYLGHDSDRGIIAKEAIITAVADDAPAAFAVAQSSPNPFNPTTTISFTIPEAGNVTVDVFNVAGQKVDTLVNEYIDAGSHSVVWDGSNRSSGVYFYTVTSGEFSKTMKMTLLR